MTQGINHGQVWGKTLNLKKALNIMFDHFKNIATTFPVPLFQYDENLG